MTKFKKWRLDNSLTQQTVANTMGCTLNTVYNWDAGKKMNYEYAQKFKAIYDIDPVMDFGIEINERVLGK